MMNEKSCPYCGAWIPEELSFCPYCMAKLVKRKQIQSPTEKRRRFLRILVQIGFWAGFGIVMGMGFYSIYCRKAEIAGHVQETVRSTADNETEELHSSYDSYLGEWEGINGLSDTRALVKIEAAEGAALRGYLILQEKEQEVLRTGFSGTIGETGILTAGYDTGVEKGQIALDLQYDQVTISVYQTEGELSAWTTGRLSETELKRKKEAL